MADRFKHFEHVIDDVGKYAAHVGKLLEVANLIRKMICDFVAIKGKVSSKSRFYGTWMLT